LGDSSGDENGSDSMKYWEIIADNLSKAGWSWGYVSSVDSNGQIIFVADAHRGDGKVTTNRLSHFLRSLKHCLFGSESARVTASDASKFSMTTKTFIEMRNRTCPRDSQSARLNENSY
jgi:hypothetical protein